MGLVVDKGEAKYAVRVAKEIYRLGGDDLAVKLAFCTIRTECDWILYPNRRVPESYRYPFDAENPNYASEQVQLSVGLFQQQVQYWGGVARCMGVESSTESWYRGIPSIGTPGLVSFDYHAKEFQNAPWRACQKVQGSQFSDGGNYREDWESAVRLFNEVVPLLKEETDMVYKDFGAAIDGERVPYGTADFNDKNAPTNTVRESWWATNRAAYAILKALTEPASGIMDRIVAIYNSIGSNIQPWFTGEKRFVYENQDPAIPDDQKGTNSFEEMTVATNGQVYRNRDVLGQVVRTQNLHTAYLQQIAEKLGVTLVDPNAKQQ